MSNLGTPVVSPPSDGVTVLRFSRTTDRFLAASWDSCLRLYQGEQCIFTSKTSTPILDCNFRDERAAFSAGLDGQVLSHNFEAETPGVLHGTHLKPIKCVEWCEEKNLIISGGWDRLVKFWDPRRAIFRGPVTSFDLPGKVYSTAQTEIRLVVATSDKHIFIFDLRNLDAGPTHRETGMQHQTRSIRTFRSGEGYGVTSIEGRVAIDYFEPQSESKKYAFRCHRKKESNGEVIYPVNAIAFHPQHGAFATGGCDGTVVMWDGENKKKITTISGYPTSIASLDFSHDGSFLAIASSYTFEEGEKEDQPNNIYIRKVGPGDIKRA